MFYGWVIVALAFVAQFIVIGTLLQSFSAFLLPLAGEFGISRAEAALPMTVISAAGVVAMPLAGRAVGIYPIRNVMLFGAVVLALGFLGVSLAPSWWMVLALYAVAGSMAMAAYSLSCNALVVNWFSRKRALALGVALFGMSISGAILTPLAGWSIASFGLRPTYQAYACLVLLLTPLIVWLAVTRPSDRGLYPDGDPAPERPEAAGGGAGGPLASTRELLGSVPLWLISAACGLVFFGATGLLTHFVAFATEDRGIDPLQATGLVSTLFIGAALGKLLFGWLSDTLSERPAFAIALLCCGTATAGLLATASYPALAASAFLYGLGFGGITPLQAALVARGLGLRNFAPAMGLTGPLMLPFQITGPPLAGLIRDLQGSYEPALWIFLGALAASAAAMALLRLPGGEPAAAAPALHAADGAE